MSEMDDVELRIEALNAMCRFQSSEPVDRRTGRKRFNWKLLRSFLHYLKEGEDPKDVKIRLGGDSEEDDDLDD